MNNDGLSRLKTTLSNQCTVRFANAEDVDTGDIDMEEVDTEELDAEEVDVKLDTEAIQWAPKDMWMWNMRDAQFWKVKETEWGKGPRHRTMASDLFKSMLSKLLCFNSVDKSLILPRGCWNRPK